MTLKIVINLGLFDKLPDLLEKNDNFLQLTAVFRTKKKLHNNEKNKQLQFVYPQNTYRE